MSRQPGPTVEELVQLVYRYYPSGLDNEDPRYEASEETRRLQTILEPARRALEDGDDTRWARFMERLHKEFDGCIVWDTSPPLYEPCYSCRIYLPWVTAGARPAASVVALLSLLAPVYTLYASWEGDDERWLKFPPFPQNFEEHAARLARLIEDEYEAARLDNDVLFMPIDDLVPPTANFKLGNAGLIDCLFTQRRW